MVDFDLFKYAVILGIAVVLCLPQAHAYKHPALTIEKDSRDQFLIEKFGFGLKGVMDMTVKKFHVSLKNYNEEIQNQIYFLIRITMIDSTEYLDPKIDFTCDPGGNSVTDRVIPLTQDWTKDDHYRLVPEIEGLYNLYFINCLHKSVDVSFELHLEQYNIDSNGQKDYLPIGLSPLPSIYLAFAAVYIGVFFVWVFAFMRKGNNKNKVHHLMTVMVILKFFSLLFYSIEQHYVKLDGSQGDGWEYAYYIFAVLRTLFFFVIVTLIGTGWSFFKPFLSDKDKKVIMVVVPLQILDNVAMIIVDSTAPGSSGWFTWKDIFRLVDIICCGAILIPIIWSIKHLREASQSDGKAARNLQKLKLFRQFYLIVVSYIYFTRIIIYLLDATLQYYLTYLGDVFTELATLTFFLVVGYKFRPIQGNPYFNLEEEDAARSEEMRVTEED